MPKNQYQERVQKFNQRKKIYSISFNQISIVRTLIFLIAIVALIFFANDRNFLWAGSIMIVFPIVFGLLVNHHNNIRYKRDHASMLALINEEELLRIEGDLKKFEKGESFLDGNHPYAKDLDVFGNNSLFQLLNRTNLSGGKSLLAQWLLYPAPNETISLRQEATKELYPQLEWRQEFQAIGRHADDEGNNVNTLLLWIEDSSLLNHRKWLKPAIFILPFVATAAIISWLYFGLSYLLPVGALVINTYVLSRMNHVAKETTEKTYKGNTALKAYGGLIEMIEKADFHSRRLKELEFNFHHHDFKASSEIKKLRLILDFLQVRINVFYQVINVIFLLDIYWLLRAEQWKKKSGKWVKNWFTSIDEIAVLNSLATFHFTNPEFCVPKLHTESHAFVATDMGHPLIKPTARVLNNFQMNGRGKVIIITGSNMAGKSTFLRTVGVNVVLALMGAPACASSLSVSNTQIFTSMRTEDNLEESVSSFYAELKRLKQLLQLIENEQPVLFMLDEILKGTNSHDRHKGAIALIDQLSKQNASGFVSTHDIELGRINEDIPGIENFSFNSEIEGDDIIFDYKITPGICKGFNASKLMEKMGIKIEKK